MSFDARYLIAALALGVGATLLMDLWNLLLRSAFGIPSLSYCLLGRWILHMAGGTFRHASIGATAPGQRECTAGWIAHYAIGLTLAAGFLIVAPREWLPRPTLLPALIYGIVTVLFPYFVMQPSLGLGIASSRAPSPAQARMKSLMTHVVFGIGLYVSAVAVNQANILQR